MYVCVCNAMYVCSGVVEGVAVVLLRGGVRSQQARQDSEDQGIDISMYVCMTCSSSIDIYIHVVQVLDLIQPIKKSKYPAITAEEEAVSRPLQADHTYIHYITLYYIALHTA